MFGGNDENEPLDGYYWDVDSSRVEELYYSYYGKLPEKYEVFLRIGNFQKEIKGDSLSFILLDSLLFTDTTETLIELFVKCQSIYYGSLELEVGTWGYVIYMNGRLDNYINEWVKLTGRTHIKMELKR
jgi:hypothetical protein